RPEVRHPGRERPLYGRPVHPGHHEELARVRFLDHGGDQPLRVELELVDRHGSQRTSTPRSLRYALASARVCVPKWKMDAASTASAHPSTSPSSRCSSEPAPPDAITGTATASQPARLRARAEPAVVP